MGFFIFIERKFLGLSHFREGPNKVLFKGYFQFIYDIIKLFLKNFIELFDLMIFTYFFIPLFLFLNIVFIWLILPFNSDFLNKEISIIYLIVLMVLKIFFFVLIIFFIYSSYRFISMIRMVIQIISYDIIIILVFLFYFIVFVDFNLSMIKSVYKFISFNFINLLIFVFWILSIMVELIRLPFDFYEGESELISGFTIEYGSFFFLILVLLEYIEIIYFSVLTVNIFFYMNFGGSLFIFFLFIIVFFFIWFRVFFVRFRLDKMLLILWKFIFPFVMIIIFIYYYLNLI